jgi:GntR family histidine utilization transcriptional repressor
MPRIRASETLHRQIQADLETKICSGRWTPGHRIPFEHELMAQYDCSRMTVNKALSALAKRGLIERKRRAGSFVASPAAHSAVLQIPDIQGEIVRRAKRYRFELLSREERKPRAGDAHEIELASGGKLLELQSVHFENDTPFALEERLISLATVPAAQRVDFATVAPGTWLLSHVPWSEAEHTITAINASRTIARRLMLELNAACLVLERRTWKLGKPVTYVRQVFPGARHSLIAHFRPSET